MRAIVTILIFAIFLVGCSEKKSATPYDLKTARSNIMSSLPTGWKVLSAPLEQSRFTSAYFDSPQIETFLILGTQSNQIDWADRQRLWHSEQLARECLYVWVVPSDSKPKFEHFDLNSYFFGPELPERIYSSRGVRIYGLVSQHIADTNRFDAILKEATTISSPPLRLSWKSWKKDIATYLDK